MKDDGPDEAERQFGVPVGDVIVPDVHKFDLKRGKGFFCKLVSQLNTQTHLL